MNEEIQKPILYYIQPRNVSPTNYLRYQEHLNVLAANEVKSKIEKLDEYNKKCEIYIQKKKKVMELIEENKEPSQDFETKRLEFISQYCDIRNRIVDYSKNCGSLQAYRNTLMERQSGIADVLKNRISLIIADHKKLTDYFQKRCTYKDDFQNRWKSFEEIQKYLADGDKGFKIKYHNSFIAERTKIRDSYQDLANSIEAINEELELSRFQVHIAGNANVLQASKDPTGSLSNSTP